MKPSVGNWAALGRTAPSMAQVASVARPGTIVRGIAISPDFPADQGNEPYGRIKTFCSER